MPMRSAILCCALIAALPLAAARYFPAFDAHKGRV